MPLPIRAPTFVLSSFLKFSLSFSRPACCKAFLLATKVYVMQSSYRLAFFLSTNLQRKSGFSRRIDRDAALC